MTGESGSSAGPGVHADLASTAQSVLDALPGDYLAFDGSEYPMPVAQAILGRMPDISELRQWMDEAAEGELQDLCEPVAVSAEVLESRHADREKYFMPDDRVRSVVFQGAKWRAGWVLVAGDAVSDRLVERFRAADYMVFSARHEGVRDQALPLRETGPIYFLQLMVRYAMIWGQIPPGEDHEMGHFLEQDMPGAVVVCGQIGAVEGLVLLELMKMGCPAVVDTGFPFDVGPRAVARTDDDILEALWSFPNMRVRLFKGEVIALPPGADSSYARETFTPGRVITGLLQLRPAECEAGVRICGDEAEDQIAVTVEVSDEALDLPISAHLEAQAIGYGSYLRGVKTRSRDDGAYLLELAQGTTLDAHLLGEVIRAGLRRQYPRLGSIRVRVAFGVDALARERALAEEFTRLRDSAILAESEETVDEFHLCIDCQPFSHKHVCVITPNRPPMCGRNRNQIKAAALWGVDYRPWTRRDISGKDLQHRVVKGEAIDVAAGEWTGLNAAVRELSGGAVDRVQIHSLGDAPHTSCGCFGALAFRIPGLEGIGIMDRGYRGTAPGQLTWSLLANRAGGKQTPGVTGITLNYLKSPRAFAGEGGLAAVKWATRKALDVMRPYLDASCRVATEGNATTIEELETFLSSGVQSPAQDGGGDGRG
jgi:CO dehydrogenase/acetyl-CoA synthase beta subunit